MGRSTHPVNHGCPNGATRQVERPVTPSGEPTQGTETSKYLQEKKSSEIPQVAASERGRAQTSPFRGSGVVGPVRGLPALTVHGSRSGLERPATAGESPVGEACTAVWHRYLSKAGA